MMRPIMVIPTSISTSVSPCCPTFCWQMCRWRLCATRLSFARSAENPPMPFTDLMMNQTPALADKLSDRQKRGHDRYDQSADDCTDGDDGKRPDDADDTVKAALQLRLIKLGDPARQHGQLAGFLAQPQHADRHRRHVARREQRVRKLAAMTDAIRSHRPGRNASGDRHDVDQDAQGGREVDAAAEQNAEIAAKQTGAVKLEDAGDAGV